MAYEWCRTPITPLFAHSFQIDESFIGFIMGASTMTGILLKLPGGILSDIWGRKPVLVLALLFMTITPFAYGLVEGPIGLLLVRFLHGGATSLFMPVTIAIIADIFPNNKGTAMGWYWSFALSGRSLGHKFSPAVHVVTGSFATTYMIAGPIGAMGLLLALAIKSPEKKQPQRKKISFRTGVQQTIKNKNILFAALAGGTLWFATGSIQANLPLYGIHEGNFGEKKAGDLFFTLVLVSLICRPLMGMLSDRIGRKPIIVSGLLLTGILIIFIMRTESYDTLLLLVAGYGLAEAMVQTCTTAFVADICSKESMGTALGVFGMLMDIGHASGLVLTGTLIVFFEGHYSKAFLVVGIMVLLAAATFLFFARPPQPQDSA